MRQQQTPSWVWFLLLFFFGSSIFGGISTVLVTYLGFPYEWSCTLTLVMMGIVFYLLYNGYSYLGWLLAGCLSFIAVSALALFRGVGVQKPDIPPDLAPYLEAQSSPFNLLAYGDYGDYGDYGYAGDMVISAYENRTLVFAGGATRTMLNINFPTQESLGGQWAFKAGEVQVSGAINGTFQADPAQNFTSAEEIRFETNAEMTSQTMQPYLVVGLPIQRAHEDKTMTLQATLEITTPSPTGATETQTLTRRFEMLVASQRYYLYLSDYDNWKRARRVVETPIWLGLVVGSLACAGASVWLVRNGALHKAYAGSFIVIVRRRGGLQTFGAEAHPLSKVETEVEKGVVLGFINAQSPAGRGGLRAGDIVTQFAEKPITTPKELDRAVAKFKKGQTAQAQVMRNGEPLEITIRF